MYNSNLGVRINGALSSKIFNLKKKLDHFYSEPDMPLEIAKNSPIDLAIVLVIKKSKVRSL